MQKMHDSSAILIFIYMTTETLIAPIERIAHMSIFQSLFHSLYDLCVNTDVYVATITLLYYNSYAHSYTFCTPAQLRPLMSIVI